MTVQTKVAGAESGAVSFGYQTNVISVLVAEIAAIILEDKSLQGARAAIRNKKHPGVGLADIRMDEREEAVYKRRKLIETIVLRTQACNQNEALLQAILVRNELNLLFVDSETNDKSAEEQAPKWVAGLQSLINHLKSTGAKLPATLARHYDDQRDTDHTPFQGLDEALENAARIVKR